MLFDIYSFQREALQNLQYFMSAACYIHLSDPGVLDRYSHYTAFFSSHIRWVLPVDS
jgi:hypothetical protein